MVRRKLWPIGLLCIAGLVGCGTSTPPQRANSTPRPAKPVPVLVFLHSSTGADPIGLETTVTRDGRVTAVLEGGRAGGRRHERKLSPAEFARLRRLVARTSLAHADRSRIPTPGGSTYILRIGHHTIVFSTGHIAPSVRPLLDTLLRLRDKVMLSPVNEPELHRGH